MFSIKSPARTGSSSAFPGAPAPTRAKWYRISTLGYRKTSPISKFWYTVTLLRFCDAILARSKELLPETCISKGSRKRERERERETILRSTNTMTPVSKWLWAQFYRSRPNVPFLLRFLRERKVHRSNLTTWTRRPRQLEKYFSKHGLNLPIRNGIRTVSIVYLSRNEIARLENRFSKKVLPSYWLWNNTATHHALRLYNV